MTNIVFIGAGNMAGSIIGGLVEQGVAPSTIFATDHNSETLAALCARTGVQSRSSNPAATDVADVLVLAVKPQVMKAVCMELAPHLREGTLVISIAAGIPCASLAQWLGAKTALVRCMPNTPALVQMGASGLYASDHVSDAQKAQAETVLKAVGTVHWVDTEALIDAVTAVSGSGPAYFFLMLEAMVDAATQQGLDADTAKALAVQTAAGAAKLAGQSELDLTHLRRNVTSPGGTTEQAILSFEANGFRQTVAKAMAACHHRAQTMAKDMGS